jgi:tetratricopeptide (TPR) repeat protein
MIGAVLFVALCEGWGREDGDEWERLVLEGTAHERAGNYMAAAVSYRDAVRIAEQPSASDLRLPLSLNSLARAHDELGNFAEAERLYKRAVAIVDKVGDTNSRTYAVLLSNLGSLYVEEGQIAKGEALLRRSLAMNARLLPAEDVQMAITCNVLAQALTKKGKHREAEQLLDRARVILEKKPQPPITLAITLNTLGVIRRKQEGTKRLHS